MSRGCVSVRVPGTVKLPEDDATHPRGLRGVLFARRAHGCCQGLQPLEAKATPITFPPLFFPRPEGGRSSRNSLEHLDLVELDFVLAK